MIKLIIADDETLIRKRLVQCIEWEALGYEVVAEATDGEELLGKIKETNADVVLTDIKMPVIDGLEVASAIRKEGLKTQFVIISGYNDFEYAQKGIEIGIFSYILKPIDKLKLIDIFRDLAKKINDSKNENQGMLYKQIFQMEQGSDENIYISNGAVAVLIYKDECKNENEAEVDTIVTEYLNSVLSSYYVVNRTPRYTTVIYECDAKDDFKQIANRLFSSINESVYELVNNDTAVSVFYTSRVFTLKNLKSEVEKLNEAEKERFYLGKKKLMDVNKIHKLSRNENYVFSADFEINIENCVEKLDFEGIRSIFRTVPLELLSERSVRVSCFLFINMIYRQLCSKSVFDESIKHLFQDFLSDIERCEFAGTIYMCIVRYLDKISQKIKASVDVANDNYLINRAMIYIENNLHKDVSLKDIAKNLDVSYGYISRLLNQSEYGGFVTQLKNKRIDRAKKLLRETNKKIYEIAYETGFKSSRYFSDVFKRETTMAPLEYRNKWFNKERMDKNNG